MEKETIVQFVCFETMGDNNEFISQWDQYSKEMNNNIRSGFNRKLGIKRKQNIYHNIRVLKMILNLFSKKKEDLHIFLKLK